MPARGSAIKKLELEGNEHLLEALLTTDEAAKILRCSRASLNKWRLRGTGPRFIYIGRRVRYRRADLADFIVSSTRNSTSDRGDRGGERRINA
jgi:hypothetical protein